MMLVSSPPENAQTRVPFIMNAIEPETILKKKSKWSNNGEEKVELRKVSHGKDRDKIVGGGVLAPKPAISDKIGTAAQVGQMQVSCRLQLHHGHSQCNSVNCCCHCQ